MVAGHRGGTEPGRRKPIAHQTTSLTDTLTTHQLFLLAIIVAIGLYLYFFVYHATLVVSIESSSTAIEYQSVEVIRLNEVLHRQQQLKQPGGKQQSTVERSVTVFDLYKHANQHHVLCECLSETLYTGILSSGMDVNHASAAVSKHPSLIRMNLTDARTKLLPSTPARQEPRSFSKGGGITFHEHLSHTVREYDAALLRARGLAIPPALAGLDDEPKEAPPAAGIDPARAAQLSQELQSLANDEDPIIALEMDEELSSFETDLSTSSSHSSSLTVDQMVEQFRHIFADELTESETNSIASTTSPPIDK